MYRTHLEPPDTLDAHIDHIAREILDVGTYQQASAGGWICCSRALRALLVMVGLEPLQDGRTYRACCLSKDSEYRKCTHLRILLVLLHRHLQS